jgi:hypothetical protein
VDYGDFPALCGLFLFPLLPLFLWVAKVLGFIRVHPRKSAVRFCRLLQQSAALPHLFLHVEL